MNSSTDQVREIVEICCAQACDGCRLGAQLYQYPNDSNLYHEPYGNACCASRIRRKYGQPLYVPMVGVDYKPSSYKDEGVA